MKTLVLTVILLLMAPAASAQDLEITFIGNEAFAITDGKATLVSDFPYESGAYGYMTYEAAKLAIGGEVLALITHRHLDHFDPNLFAETGWTVIGPQEVTRGLDQSRVIPLGATVRHGPLEITPVKSEHGNTEHYSYLVNWGERSLYFFGDTEGYAEFLNLNTKVDVLFISPWALWQALRDKAELPAARILVYHHKPTEPVPECPLCSAPRQGEVFRLNSD